MKTKQPPVKILLCDDDLADRKLVRVYLKQITDREFALLEAGQIDEIQNALDKGRVDLVFMDLQMPEKSGMEWLAEIVARQTAPVVMLTGSGSEEVAVQSLQVGAMGYLPKASLSKEKLIKTIDSALEKWRQIQQSRADQEKLERLANFDALTGIYNRRAILRRLDEQISYAKRYGEDFSLLMLDIDYFKKVNDQYGHLTGDNVLEKFATLVQQNIRDTDTIGRYGGEEFIITLPHTSLSSALDIAERIRRTIEAAKMKDFEGKVFSITVSQGLSSYKAGEGKLSLIARADDALYRAKENGRNRVETSA
ncbi:MAG: diguanylate cyclase [Chloroflexota bacterium]|nr:diguanylate cyclase [Chloroflexota bacterium]